MAPPVGRNRHQKTIQLIFVSHVKHVAVLGQLICVAPHVHQRIRFLFHHIRRFRTVRSTLAVRLPIVAIRTGRTRIASFNSKMKVGLTCRVRIDPLKHRAANSGKFKICRKMALTSICTWSVGSSVGSGRRSLVVGATVERLVVQRRRKPRKRQFPTPAAPDDDRAHFVKHRVERFLIRRPHQELVQPVQVIRVDDLTAAPWEKIVFKIFLVFKIFCF